MPDIAITGTGLLTAAGAGVHRTWEALDAGRPRFTAGAGLPWPVAAVDPALAPWPEGARWKNIRKYASPGAHWGLAVARAALEQAAGEAAWESGAQDGARGGTVVAVSSNGSDELAEILPRLAVLAQSDERPIAELLYDEVPDYAYIRSIPSQLGQFVALASGFEGSNLSVYGETGAGGLGALALAVRLITSGELDRVLVVGVSPPLPLTTAVAFDREERFGREPHPGSGPFDLDRAGTFVGQGAAALLIENADTARARGAAPLAGLAACETLCAADRSAAAAAVVEQVLAHPGSRADLWWAHGAGSPELDLVECEAVAPRLGPAVPTTSSKGTVGNALECSALIDAVLAVEALRQGRVPPVGLLQKPDPALGAVDFVVGEPRAVPGATGALVTALGHGRDAVTAGAAVIVKGS
ncbi:beta-ketoacyl synthase N-terminal-like domain-containing protein [Kitasatospora sp. NPDC048239]|uniref:beta-ketoacyl synthase N-terminal-like domain-containing protein n=1 Tax=Kitasatospora sp. NPDC048239 TaxID=3364046 RepID=UPI00370FD9D0